jgi:uncharacterized membrane protein|tara:strand:+ start:80 stop:223 length:144 start_codon:yes stop_codon:yes gene_type:complete
METIGIGIAGMGFFSLIGTLYEERPENSMIVISIALIALGFFIASFA